MQINSLFENQNQVVDRNSIKTLFDGNTSDSSTSNENIEKIYEPLIKNYNNWMNQIRVALISNCGFVNYDVKANNDLKVLLEEINQISFETNI